jgi:hypothetical protein
LIALGVVRPMDEMTWRLDAFEPDRALELLEGEFPGWKTWLAGGLCHALPRHGPAFLVHGVSPADLRDQIIRAEACRQRRPARGRRAIQLPGTASTS